MQQSYPFKKQYPGTKFFYGDGFEGLPTFAPFDRVIITAAAPFTPPKLIDQMKPGGMMVIPRDEGESQRMLRITKQADGSVIEESFDLFSSASFLACCRAPACRTACRNRGASKCRRPLLQLVMTSLVCLSGNQLPFVEISNAGRPGCPERAPLRRASAKVSARIVRARFEVIETATHVQRCPN